MRKALRTHWLDFAIALAIFALALAIYNATLTPSLSYKSADGNELATVCYTLGLAHSTGYPLYTWLGKLFTFIPVGDVAHRVNLMSAVLGAAGAALLYLIMLTITNRRLPSAFTALLFAFSLTFWSQAVIAEVYAPNVFMITLTVWLLLRPPSVPPNPSTLLRAGFGGEVGRNSLPRAACLLLAAFAFGLSLGTHLSNLGFALAFALYVLLVDWRVLKKPALIAGALVLFLLGCLQFLWLPYKSSTLNDAFMLRNAPRTLQSIYRYTLGAFPEFKFAFPLQAIPDRIVLYLELLRQNFGLTGIALGVYGMWEMLFRHTRKFYLFIAMYLVHVFFFIQYRVFDLDVFFIPAHFIYVIFIGYGVHRLVEYVRALLNVVDFGSLDQTSEVLGLWRGVVNVGLAVLLCLPIAREVQANYERNDYSDETAINDFYENVFEFLPEGSVFLGRGGVFGHDMFYFRLVYNLRPDVLMPHLTNPRPSPEDVRGRQIYTTMRLDSPQAGRGPWALPPGLVESDAWHIPVLMGQSDGPIPGGRGRDLVLYRVNAEPPELVVRVAEPEYPISQQLGGLELLGYDLDGEEVSQGGHLHLTFYWRVLKPEQALIVTMLGDESLEAHPLGLGNLSRYMQEFRPPQDAIIVEDYLLVVPSQTPAGWHTLKVGLQEPLRPGQGGQSNGEVLEIGEILVTR
ncbi:MAG: protein O-mannosyl-transferase family [Anaerolineae bacterium]